MRLYATRYAPVGGHGGPYQPSAWVVVDEIGATVYGPTTHADAAPTAVVLNRRGALSPYPVRFRPRAERDTQC